MLKFVSSLFFWPVFEMEGGKKRHKSGIVIPSAGIVVMGLIVVVLFFTFSVSPVQTFELMGPLYMLTGILSGVSECFFKARNWKLKMTIMVCIVFFFAGCFYFFVAVAMGRVAPVV